MILPLTPDFFTMLKYLQIIRKIIFNLFVLSIALAWYRYNLTLRKGNYSYKSLIKRSNFRVNLGICK